MTPIDTYIAHMNSLNPEYIQFSVTSGKRYHKVIGHYVADTVRNSGSVHAFIDIKTLDLYKAATWTAPAKHARFNLITDMDRIKQVADIYTSYLYKS